MATRTAVPSQKKTGTATLDDLLSVPDDGLERWLIDGEIVEVGPYESFSVEAGMTIRNKAHGWIENRVGQHLANWNDSLPKPRGGVYSGEIGIRLTSNPKKVVGADVVYLSAAMMASQTDNDEGIIDDAPLLAVEVISPSDTTKRINDKIRLYQKHGVALIWVIDPYSRTLSIPRQGQPPIVLTEEHELVGEPHLPGFRIPVIKLFE